MNNKICFLQRDLGGGGAERKACTLANYFVSQGRQVEIGLFGNDNIAYKLDPKIRVTVINRETYEYKSFCEKMFYHLKKFSSFLFFCVPAGIIGGIFKTFRIKNTHNITYKRFKEHFEQKYNYTEPIRSYIKRRKNCVYITMMAQTYVMIMDVIADEVRKGRIKNPYLVMECNNPTPGMDATVSVDEKRNKFFPLATKCVVMNTGIRDYFAGAIREKCVIIPNPVRSDLPLPYTGERRKTVVNFCRLNRQKNLPLLINAFEIFHKSHPDYTLEIYGEGELKEELNNLINDKGLSDVAFIYPFKSNIHEIIKDAMMYVSSSDWEGFPNSVMEALSIGMPVISTDCDFGPSDLIENGVNGVLVKPGDVNEMAEAMSKLVSDDSFRNSISSNAVNTRYKYDVNKIGEEWLALIDSLKER